MDDSAHWVTALEVSPSSVAVTLCSSRHPERSRRAIFASTEMVSVDDSYSEPDEMEKPWDIIGFDCDQLRNERWRFCLHTDCIEYVFDSTWPEIT